MPSNSMSDVSFPTEVAKILGNLHVMMTKAAIGREKINPKKLSKNPPVAVKAISRSTNRNIVAKLSSDKKVNGAAINRLTPFRLYLWQ